MTVELLAVDPVGGRRSAACYLAGIALPVITLTALGLFVAPSTLARGFVGDDRVVDVVDVVLGVLLVAVGFWLLVHRHKTAAIPHPPSGAGKLVWLGVAMMVTNLSTLVMVIAGLREIVHANIGAAGQLIGAALLVVGAVAPVVVPLGLDVAAPGPSRRVLDPAQRLVARHGATIGFVVAMIFGAYLIGRGARAW